ncbi:EamA family transporter [Microbacterium sp. A204]|uniref:EamA family transporter n=1 Tax=Microbacterium sp. A204 TaxID=3457321 RepID=UPI003FD52A3C
MPLLTILLTAFAPAVWGTTYIVTTELLPPGHPLLAGLLRSLPAGLLAITIGRRLPRGDWWWKASVLGFLNIGAFFPLLFVAAERLPGGVAAAVGAIQPLIILGLGALVVGERIRIASAIAAFAGTAGVALIVLGPAAALDAGGILAAIGGVMATASGIVLTKRWGRPPGVDAVSYAGWQLTAGGLFLLPFVMTFEGLPGQLDSDAVLGYAWLGIAGGLIAYALWFRGIQRLPVIVPGLLVLLSPIVATVLGTIVAGEAFTGIQLIGLALAFGSLAGGQFAARGRQPTLAPVVVAGPLRE